MRWEDAGAGCGREVQGIGSRPVLLVLPQRCIDWNRDILKQELGLTEEDIIDLPALFKMDKQGKAMAYFPNMVRAPFSPSLGLGTVGTQSQEQDLWWWQQWPCCPGGGDGEGRKEDPLLGAKLRNAA